ncbi:hypothetical protein [Hydrogenimonas cancrithermarum]|uniref:Uncharacterized protein n=1 Tax=Hydrogenimonas cancrithermarum TaxID=2993563 RepID=A0ABM8FL23_9BACT|nr:hypothetical protein [Hydrogenimonas cancrithermarum]BDY12905.1 hypothetical protein HCR_12170 [Hydrogenimonas cancrithermarum]BDY13022.1 hypothetical protein HCR_13340 [Hydrogenimonas cancrithermarum]
MKRLKRELVVFFGLFVLLALGMHFKEWMDHPVAHLSALSGSPLGVLHPIYITAGVYLLLLMIRLFVGLLGKILEREK